MRTTRFAAMTAVAAVVLGILAACGGSSDNSSKANAAASSNAAAISAASTTATSAAATATGSTATDPTSTDSTSEASNSASTDPSASDGASSDSPSFVNGGAALADTGNLVYVLEAVNPKMGTDKNDLVAKSKELCAKINANESEGQLEDDAAKGFTNGSWVPSDSEAQAIVGTVKAYGGC